MAKFHLLKRCSTEFRYIQVFKILVSEMLLKVFNHKILVQFCKSVNNLNAIPNIPLHLGLERHRISFEQLFKLCTGSWSIVC